MSVIVRRVNGQKYKIELDEILELTVFEVKGMIEVHWPDLETDFQKLIHKGKILEDEQTLKDCGVSHGNRLVVVKPKTEKKKAAKPVENATEKAVTSPPSSDPSQETPVISHPAPQTNPAPSVNPPPQMHPNPFANAAQMNMGNMMNPQQLMQNPEMMQQMMQNPMFQNMMNSMMQNPDMLQSMFESNPQLQQILDQNPQIRHVLNDPETLQQAMQAVRNPEVYQEMLRNQDRAIANISNMPGGFNALSRMYNQVQSPMEDALANMQHQQESTAISDVDQSTGPNSNAMPNPFSNSPQPTNAQPNPRANPAAGGMPPNMMQFLNQMQNQQANGMGANPMANNPFFSNMIAAPQPPANPQEAYANQLAQLAEMGFSNEQENINALNQARGNVQGAVNILMGNRGMM